MVEEQNKIGNDNVILGNRKGRVGSRNVIIEPTDINGNTILNRPMIIGYDAKGGPNDIIIGSGAGSRSELFLLLDQLQKIISETNDPKTVQEILSLISEVREHPKNKSKIKALWGSIKAAVTIGSAVKLITEISNIIGSLK